MFDWYEPRESFACPACGAALRNWQGKDGPCGLFVWREGERSPVEQRVDRDARLESLARFTLPETFGIAAYCGSHRVEARGTCAEGVWTQTTVVAAESWPPAARETDPPPPGYTEPLPVWSVECKDAREPSERISVGAFTNEAEAKRLLQIAPKRYPWGSDWVINVILVHRSVEDWEWDL